MRGRQSTSGVASVWSAGGLVASALAILLAMTVGLVADPDARLLLANLNLSQDGAGQVGSADGEPTGEVTEVTVKATADMTYEPATIEVPAGDELVVTLVNEDEVSGHDLVIGDVESSRLAPGTTETLNYGIQGASQEGYCSVAGHRQMGMTLDVVVTGAGGQATTAEDETGLETRSVIPHVDDAELSDVYPGELPPLPRSEDPVTHEVTLTVSEEPLEVAPGLWQVRWTFNGSSMGPTLHGKVGDRFEITLVNDGTIGHSIDFHAGALAPDEPMRTIAPGESLVYEYTATRAGMWMYHCSTDPIPTHIAAGMHGAVIIEPADLDPVDRQYVVVQSEVYLAGEAHTAKEAEEVDASKIPLGQPDRVVFNGIADQYVQEHLPARVGESVRFWVLDAGPNVPFAFHIVGGQFDTTWSEGAYHIRRGESWTGATDGGAQVMSLLPAEGGFVELEFPEAGTYAMVNHVMSEAERGARGYVRVTD